MPNTEGTGFLYPKKNHTGNQPNLTGKFTLNGTEYEIAAWKKVKGTVPWLSLKIQAVTPPDPAQTTTEAVPATAEDDIPF